LLAPRPWQVAWIWPVLGILLIGLSSAALNQWQDRELDKKMRRTKWRPLPSGRVTPNQVLVFVFITIFSGLGILFYFTNVIATVLGFSAFFWYNGIYTYLKRVSPIAVIPGSVIGGVPPAVGWAAAGGDIHDPFILSICFFMFIWQIPHFWLLLFLYGDDYKLAGLPTMLDIMSEYSLRLWTFLGLLLTIATAVYIPIAGVIYHPLVMKIITTVSILVLWFAKDLLIKKRTVKYKSLFIMINIYSVFILIVILSAGLYLKP
jgi:protoheme IX farnesyltransferase